MQSILTYRKLCSALRIKNGRNPNPRVPAAISITCRENDIFNRMCDNYNLSRNEVIEQLQVLLLWYMQRQQLPAATAPTELIGHLIVNPQEINAWCTRCLELTEQIQYSFDSLVGTMCLRETRLHNTQQLSTYHEDYKGKEYSDTDLAHKISASFWVNGVKSLIIHPIKEDKPVAFSYAPNEDVREKLRKTFTRDGLAALGLDKFLFRGVGGTHSEYAFSYFLKSVISLFHHGAFAGGGNLIGDIDTLHLLYLQLLEKVLVLYSRLEAQEVRVRRFRDLVCEATGSAQLKIDEGLPQ